MAILKILGTAVDTGASVASVSVSFTDYILESATDGGRNVDYDDVLDSDGKRVTRIIFNREKKLVLTLICKDGATPLTDFAEGAMCAHTGLTTFFVDSAPISRVKGAAKVTATLTEVFVSSYPA